MTVTASLPFGGASGTLVLDAPALRELFGRVPASLTLSPTSHASLWNECPVSAPTVRTLKAHSTRIVPFPDERTVLRVEGLREGFLTIEPYVCGAVGPAAAVPMGGAQ